MKRPVRMTRTDQQSAKVADFVSLWGGHVLASIAIVVSVFSLFESKRATDLEAEEREEKSAMVWRSTKLADEDAIALTQPNDGLAVQGVLLKFPDIVRSDPVYLTPDRMLVRPEWLLGLDPYYKNCGNRGFQTVIGAAIPVAVTTGYVRGKRRFSATDFYTLHATLSLSEQGLSEASLDSLAIATGPKISQPIERLVGAWAGLPQTDKCKSRQK